MTTIDKAEMKRLAEQFGGFFAPCKIENNPEMAVVIKADCLLRLLQHVADMGKPKWLPIDDAAKSGEKILIFKRGCEPITAAYLGGKWMGWVSQHETLELYEAPTHWMPIPTSPSEEV